MRPDWQLAAAAAAQVQPLAWLCCSHPGQLVVLCLAGCQAAPQGLERLAVAVLHLVLDALLLAQLPQRAAQLQGWAAHPLPGGC